MVLLFIGFVCLLFPWPSANELLFFQKVSKVFNYSFEIERGWLKTNQLTCSEHGGVVNDPV
jgi:hypothetical protein